jgi:putative endonuclease
MPATRSDIGAWGEAIAARYLSEHGYSVRERNWRHGHGELDIIAATGDEIVFVEVRTRRSHAYGAPEETLRAAKQAKLIETAQAYLQEHGIEEVQWRIDVIVVEMDARQNVTRLEHIESAITQPSST